VTTILLARHGETDWNRLRRIQGQLDPPLNERGRRQARALAAELSGEGITGVYSSDLRRAQETAEIVAASLGLGVEVDPALREIDTGDFSGMTISELERQFPERLRRWQQLEGPGWIDGESYEHLAERVVSALERIARNHPGDTVLAVTHGGPIRAVGAHATGLEPLEYRRQTPVVANCRLFRTAFLDGRFSPID
jgi:2,3-bisphosphoglycerate-dependent phosphoglycerate mutase